MLARSSTALFLLLLTCGTRASAAELDDIRAAIQTRGARWTAAENPVSRLSPQERRLRLGGLPPQRRAAVRLLTIPPGGLTSPLGAALPPGLAGSASYPSGVAPATLDWRNFGGFNYVTAVKNQGSCADCWAFATTAGLESYALITQDAPGQNLDLSEQILVSCSGAGTCSGGGYADQASSYLENPGDGPESAYPYAASNGLCASAASGWQNGAYRIGSWSWVAAGSAPSASTLESALAAYGPIVAWMKVYGDFYSYSSGVYSYSSGPFESNHFVLVVGYDRVGQYFIVKNSWGSSWGEGGYFRIAYSQLSSAVQFGTWAIAYSVNPAASSLSLAIAGPGDGQTVSGLVPFSGTASETTANVALTRVEVSVDGGARAVAQGTSRWSYTLDSTALSVGAHTVTVTAVDSAGNAATAGIGINVVLPPPPVITSALSAAGAPATPFSYQVTVSNGPARFSAAGLPPGLGIDAANGLIAGTPTTTGSWRASVSASNSGGTGTAVMAVTIAPSAGPASGPVQVWPQPCEFGGDASSPYHSSSLNFANLPTSGARVRLFAMTGELMADSGQILSGTYSWDGNNRSGHKAASGTYYATIEGGGQTKVRRVVIIR